MRIRILSLLAPLALMACQLDKAARIDVRMDSTDYTRNGAGVAQAGFTIANTGGAAAYLAGCAQPVTFDADLLVGSTWQVRHSEGGDTCPAGILPTSQTVEAGETKHATFAADTIGVFRLRVFYGTASANPWGYVVSGTSFQVH